MMWYSHWDTGGKLKDMEIGLASLRRDGFGYLSRKIADSQAHVVTTTFQANGNAPKMFLNVDGVSEEAAITVELLDHLDQPLPEFSGENAATVIAAGTRSEVVWPKPIPVNRKLAIKITFPEKADAKLYAVYVGESE